LEGNGRAYGEDAILKDQDTFSLITPRTTNDIGRYLLTELNIIPATTPTSDIL
jgi:hypothetical protein